MADKDNKDAPPATTPPTLAAVSPKATALADEPRGRGRGFVAANLIKYGKGLVFQVGDQVSPGDLAKGEFERLKDAKQIVAASER